MDAILPVAISLGGGLLLYVVIRLLARPARRSLPHSISPASHASPPELTYTAVADLEALPDRFRPPNPLDLRVMYTWAAQGPFQRGDESSLAMAAALLTIHGEDTLQHMFPSLLEHEGDYNRHVTLWEALRRKTVHRARKRLGTRLNQCVKDAEAIRESQFGVMSELITNVSQQLLHEPAYCLPEPLNPASAPEVSTMEGESQAAHFQRDESRDIWDALRDRLTTGLAAVLGVSFYLIMIVTFFGVWIALIIGSPILGLAFGWIPALIISAMVSIIAPFVLIIAFILVGLLVLVIGGWALLNGR